MDFPELIHARRSVRAYKDQPVERKLLDLCLDAARMAPSACNSQPWTFLVIDDRETICHVADTACSGIYTMNRFIATAPVLIIFVTEKSKLVARMGGQVRDVRYNLIDIGIAGAHLTLQAAVLGLGTCWIGWFNEKALKKTLKLPLSTQVDIIMPLGYPDEEPKDKLRKSLNEVRQYLKWGK
ncbi:MAG: NAD(P)H nitroreductase [Acidobacteria bacterium]|nr:NAD(P)H nitroreductase [Acidobacteriota bacterium]